MNIHEDTFVSESSIIIGGITIAKGSSNWPRVILSADMEDVSIGKHTNIQDNSTVHVDRGSLVTSMSGEIVRSLTK